MPRIDHIALYSLDLERLKAFYETYFGAVAGPLYHNAAKSFSSYFLRFEDNTRLEIMHKIEVNQSANPIAIGYAHLAISVGSKEAVDAKTTELVQAGYKRMDGPRTTGDGYYESKLADPDGNQIEITV